MCFLFEMNDDIALYPFLMNSVNNFGYDLDDEYFDIQGAYGYNGVIASSYNILFREKFYASFRQYCFDQKAIAEFYRYNPINGNHLFSERFVELFKNRQTVALNLDQSYEDIWASQYSSKNRNMIRKGSRTLTFEIRKGKEHIECFQKMYEYTMKRIGADDYYYFKNGFFKDILATLNNKCFLFIAYDNNTQDAMGGLLLLINKNKAHYFLSARSELCNNNSVNNYLLDCAIKFAQKNNCTVFHFGGGNTVDHSDPLLKFKKSFSRDIFDFFISKKIIFPDIYKTVCDIWEKRNPSKVQQFNNYLLKYHE